MTNCSDAAAATVSGQLEGRWFSSLLIHAEQRGLRWQKYRCKTLTCPFSDSQSQCVKRKTPLKISALLPRWRSRAVSATVTTKAVIYVCTPICLVFVGLKGPQSALKGARANVYICILALACQQREQHQTRGRRRVRAPRLPRFSGQGTHTRTKGS